MLVSAYILTDNKKKCISIAMGCDTLKQWRGTDAVVEATHACHWSVAAAFAFSRRLLSPTLVCVNVYYISLMRCSTFLKVKGIVLYVVR